MNAAGRPKDLGIDGYSDFVRIGSGGYSTVYKARQELFDRTVAVKVLAVPVVDESAQRRFRRECSAAGRISDHPHIVTVYDAGFTASGSPYIASEFEPGGSLADQVRERGLFAIGEVVTIGRKIAGALQAVHAAGVLHRDIKPANILLSAYDEPMLADFGIAPEEHITATGRNLATPFYTAPEVLRGKEPTIAGDVYALAATLYEVVEGHAPYQSLDDPYEGMAELLERILGDPLPDLVRPDLPDNLRALLISALSKDPGGRPRTAQAFADALDQIHQELLESLAAAPPAGATAPAAAHVPAPAPAPSGQWQAAAPPPAPSGQWAAVGPPAAPSGQWPMAAPPAPPPAPSGQWPATSTDTPPPPGPPTPHSVPTAGDTGLVRWITKLPRPVFWGGIAIIGLLAVIGLFNLLGGDGEGGRGNRIRRDDDRVADDGPRANETDESPLPQAQGVVESVLLAFGDEGLGGRETHPEFVQVVDDTGVIVIPIPAEWTELDGRPVEFGSILVPGIAAGSDLSAFDRLGGASGVNLFRFTGDVATDEDTFASLLLDRGITDEICNGTGTIRPYDDGRLQGTVGLFTECAQDGSVFLTLLVEPPAGEVAFIVDALVREDADLDAVNRILESVAPGR